MARQRLTVGSGFGLSDAAPDQQLYQIERDTIELDPDGRHAMRQEHSVPRLAKIDAERQALARIVLPKSTVGEAVRYLTNQWAALQRFVEDGRLAIDNNRAENQLRLVAVGRRTGSSRAALKARGAPRCCTRWSRAAN